MRQQSSFFPPTTAILGFLWLGGQTGLYKSYDKIQAISFSELLSTHNIMKKPNLYYFLFPPPPQCFGTNKQFERTSHMNLQIPQHSKRKASTRNSTDPDKGAYS